MFYKLTQPTPVVWPMPKQSVRRGGAGRGAGHGGLPEAGLEGLPPLGQLQVEDKSPWHEQTLSTTRKQK